MTFGGEVKNELCRGELDVYKRQGEACHAALDVQELLRAQVGAEARLLSLIHISPGLPPGMTGALRTTSTAP